MDVAAAGGLRLADRRVTAGGVGAAGGATGVVAVGVALRRMLRR